VFQLLTDLAAAVDEGEVSHCQVAVSVVVPETKAEALKRRAQAAGGTASSHGTLTQRNREGTRQDDSEAAASRALDSASGTGPTWHLLASAI